MIATEIQEWQELMTKVEDLHPDLVWYLEGNSTFGQILKHPLVFSIPHFDQMNAMVNKQYEYKKNYIKGCVDRKDWSQYIFMHERPYRVQAFQRIAKSLTDVEYWDLLGSIWTDSENIWQNYLLFKKLLRSKRPHKERIMDEDEREVLAELPNEIRVYRGHMDKNRRGLSWSVNSHTAGWFAYRFDEKNSGVVTGLVSKDKIQALLLGRSEFEVIINPKDVREQKPYKRTLKPSDPFRQIFLDNWNQAPLKVHGHTLHGLQHWYKVDRNGVVLAGLTPGADLKVVRLFAAFHDSQRENEDHDPDHGKRAVQFLRQQVKRGAISLNSDQVGKLAHACLYHEKGRVSKDPTIGCCWDADRLDLVRVGIVPRAKLLSTQAGKNLICKI